MPEPESGFAVAQIWLSLTGFDYLCQFARIPNQPDTHARLYQGLTEFAKPRLSASDYKCAQVGEASLAEVRQSFEQEVKQGDFIELDRQPGAAGRVFTDQEMLDLERDNVRAMREGQNEYPALVNFETRCSTGLSMNSRPLQPQF